MIKFPTIIPLARDTEKDLKQGHPKNVLQGEKPPCFICISCFDYQGSVSPLEHIDGLSNNPKQCFKQKALKNILQTHH